MKIAILVLTCLSAALADSETPLRLPLPTEIANRIPHLLHEPIDSPFVKIVGGSAAASGSAKHQIALLRSGSFTCGGSLITSNVVLTAAHCVYGNENNPASFTIRYGTLDRTSGPTIAVSKVNRHAQYSSNTIDYDVATLVLKSSFTPGTNAAVISLTSTAPAAGSTVIVTGWGRLSSGGSLPTKLQQASLKVVSKSECQSRWGGNSITDRMICAHSTTQSACNGDSGGPITQNGALVGVVSWGSSSCLHASYPNVYANVANLRTWIQNNS